MALATCYVPRMSETYAITIEAIHDRTVRARVHLVNSQFPEVPANRCLGLQILADAYRGLRHSHRDTNQTTRTAARLAARADQRLVAYSEDLAARYDDEFNRELAEKATSEIVRIVEVDSANFDATKDWHEHNESGRENLVPFRDLNAFQILEFEVRDARFLDHLAIGLIWETAMYARDERY